MNKTGTPRSLCFTTPIPRVALMNDEAMEGRKLNLRNKMWEEKSKEGASFRCLAYLMSMADTCSAELD